MELEEIKKLTEQGEKELLKSDKVLIENLPLFVWIPEFINIAGSLFYEREDNRKPNDIDIIVRAKEDNGKFTITLDKSLRLKIDRILEKRVGEMSGRWLTPEWLGSTFGPDWKYQTGWDLVLVPHQPQEIREINEPEFAEEFYKQTDKDIILMEFGKLKEKGLPEDELVEEIAKILLPIGFNIEYWKIKVKEVLKEAGQINKTKEDEFYKQRHSREKCMECDKSPFYECLWAEGIAHAWFCRKHFKE